MTPPEQDGWLLLHGTPLTPAVWDAVSSVLRERGPVVCPDLAAVPDGPDPQMTLATSVLSALDSALGWHVVGHSFGGQVALELALAAPERVRSLTLLCSRDTPFPAFAEAAGALRSEAPVDTEAPLRRWFEPADLRADPALVAYARRCLEAADRQAWARALDGIAAYDASARTPRLSMPVTLVAAEHDPVSTPAAMRAMAERVADAELHVVPGAAHLTPFVDSAALARLVLAAARPTGAARGVRAPRSLRP